MRVLTAQQNITKNMDIDKLQMMFQIKKHQQYQKIQKKKK